MPVEIEIEQPEPPPPPDHKPVQLLGRGIKRQISDDINIFGPWLFELVDDLIKTCKAENGVGLAAPQLGIYKRVVVVKAAGQELVLLNPKILSLEGRMRCTEGCLSIPGARGLINRAEKVTIVGYCWNWGQYETGAAAQLEFDGFLGQVVQHEIDHLDGKFFIDRLSKIKRDIIEKKFAKMLKNAEMSKRFHEDPAFRRDVQLRHDSRRRMPRGRR
jgi:peptide deformylase